MSVAQYTGYVAAFCTTAAYAPQVVKVWRTRRTADISLMAFSVLVTGQALWLLYGVLIRDWPLILSNAVTLTMTVTILTFKIRHMREGAPAPDSGDAIPSVSETPKRAGADPARQREKA